MTVTVGCALFNYEAGGLRPENGYDFKPLQNAMAVSPRVPDLIQFCEGKHYARDGGKGLLLAAKALSDQFGVPYVGLLGYNERGPMPPVIFYNALKVLHLPPWHGHGSVNAFADQRNIGHFLVRGAQASGGGDLRIIVGVEHWEPLYSPIREFAARRWGRYGTQCTIPALLSGDLNCTPSGDHFAQRDWAYAAENDWFGATHKGHEVDGIWAPNTAPLDYLVGSWRDGDRHGGAGFTLLAEAAWRACREQPVEARPDLLGPDGRILPTVNTGVDAGGGLHIDIALANDPMLRYFDPASFQIHVPPVGVRNSDHRLLTWEMAF
ncbi:hypothetical protein [Actinoplanes sp. NPDC051851]|uniref:hypothetical protein n=1 Tax=Actinoplanes sp. NPDC051851 TaxID=3154753 RepID=UPI00342E3DCF